MVPESRTLKSVLLRQSHLLKGVLPRCNNLDVANRMRAGISQTRHRVLIGAPAVLIPMAAVGPN